MDEQERGASESSFASQRPTIADTALREVLLSLGYSLISINWRAKPLTSLEVVLELISHTTTEQGLTVTAGKDSQTYPTGLKVTDEDLACRHLLRDAFHGDWNYTIKPQAC